MENRIMDCARYRILFVEDNTLDQMAFKRFVDNNAIPYDCTIVGSVAESRDVLGETRFDIIITDHSLGDGTAIDVLQSAGSTPVIVVTGAGDEETAVKTWKAGAYDYLRIADQVANMKRFDASDVPVRDEQERSSMSARAANGQAIS